jgi:ABC-type Na+ efflux pump permease subunit
MILCVSLLVCAVLNLSMFPIMFKVGYLKGRMWGLYLPVIVVGSLIVAFWLLCVNNGSVQAWVDQAEIWVAGSATWIAIIFLAIAALLLALSYTLSCRIYAKRDF